MKQHNNYETKMKKELKKGQQNNSNGTKMNTEQKRVNETTTMKQKGNQS